MGSHLHIVSRTTHRMQQMSREGRLGDSLECPSLVDAGRALSQVSVVGKAAELTGSNVQKLVSYTVAPRSSLLLAPRENRYTSGRRRAA